VDDDASDWTLSATVAISGTLTINTGNGTVTVPYSTTRNDTPDDRSVLQGTAFIDWLDAPGIGQVSTQGEIVAADLTFKFTARVTHDSGSKCSRSWSMRVQVKDGKPTWTTP
jgi:hypothetical protein